MDIRTFYAYIHQMPVPAFIPANQDHRSLDGASSPPDFSHFQRAHTRAVRHHIRATARRYRRRDLTDLIHCPEDWLASSKPEVADALIGRLKRALYVERQKRDADVECSIHSRLTALRIALCGELATRREARSRSTQQAPLTITSRYE